MNRCITSAEVAARLFREPFNPFTLKLKDGRAIRVETRGQLIVSETTFAAGSNLVGRGVFEAIAVESMAAIEQVIDSESADAASKPVASDGVLRLFTDGACQGNPGPGGWGYIIKDGAGVELGRGSGGERPTTNNRMELTSVIRGLEALDSGQAVRLITDSQYVAKGLSEWMKGWKRNGWRRKTAKGFEPLANDDLWRRLDELTADRKITCEWVRGHAGHPENEECDRMAVDAAMGV